MGMTTNEAIEILRKNRPTSDPRPCGMELCEAVDMAISALRQQEHFRDITKKVEPLTNAQKIRAMTDEELVNFLMRLMGHAQCFAEGIFPYHPCPQEQNCKQCGLDWLQQPAEEDDHDERKENENA